MIFKAKNGAEIVERIYEDDVEASDKFANLNHALVIVKIEDDYLLGYHKWRDDWEIFGGLLEEGKACGSVLHESVRRNLELPMLSLSIWESCIITCRLIIGIANGMRNMADYMESPCPESTCKS